jgi:hypothetical protein
MKARFFFGMIALVSVSLFFPACSSDDSTDSGAAAAAALVSGNTDLEGNVTLNGSTIIVNSSITLTDNLTIPAGVTLSVTGTDEIKPDSGKTLAIASGGTLSLDDMDNFDDTAGSLELRYGSTLIIGGDTLVRGHNAPLTWDPGDTASKMTINDSINGIELTGKFNAHSHEVFSTLIITSDSTLTIKGDLDIEHSIEGDTTGGGGAPRVVVAPGVTVSGTDNNNFYPSDSTTAGGAVAGKTYEWNASANGSGTAGWKATS